MHTNDWVNLGFTIFATLLGIYNIRANKKLKKQKQATDEEINIKLEAYRQELLKKLDDNKFGLDDVAKAINAVVNSHERLSEALRIIDVKIEPKTPNTTFSTVNANAPEILPDEAIIHESLTEILGKNPKKIKRD